MHMDLQPSTVCTASLCGDLWMSSARSKETLGSDELNCAQNYTHTYTRAHLFSHQSRSLVCNENMAQILLRVRTSKTEPE